MTGTGRAVAVGLAAWALALAANRSLRRVRGGSMEPTLHDDELVLTLPLGRVQRGDVVLLRDPRDATHGQVKRVIGLPGEIVEVRGGTLLIDGRRYREAHAQGLGPDGRLAAPPDHVVVLGDARDASTDSRVYGAVPLDLVDRRVPVALGPPLRRLRSSPVPITAARSEPVSDAG